MRIIAGILLIFYTVELWFFVRKDAEEYAAFKLLTATRHRQRQYRAWMLKSFLVLTVSSSLGIALMRRIGTFVRLPVEFTGISQMLRSHLPSSQISSGFMAGLCIAIVAGLIGGIVVATMLSRLVPAKKTGPIAIGDIEALLPRNWPETAHTALLSLNAGLGEEICFRLLLPLLGAMASGSAILAFTAATILFGLMHAYQGIAGVAITTVLGAAFTCLYLATGSLWIAVAVHAGFDLIGLVVRPSILRLVATRARITA